MAEVKRYVAKPVEVEAILWTGDNYDEIVDFCNGNCRLDDGRLIIETLEGTVPSGGERRTIVGCYIVKGVRGEFYPVRSYVFEMKYNEVVPGVDFPFSSHTLVGVGQSCNRCEHIKGHAYEYEGHLVKIFCPDCPNFICQ